MTTPRRRCDAGAAAVELAVFAPLLVALALLAVLGYRTVSADFTADAVAHSAARAATLERTPERAVEAAHTVVADALRTRELSCARYDLALVLNGLEPGAAVTATLTCHADLSDLSGLAVPGSHTSQGHATAVVDTYRSLP